MFSMSSDLEKRLNAVDFKALVVLEQFGVYSLDLTRKTETQYFELDGLEIERYVESHSESFVLPKSITSFIMYDGEIKCITGSSLFI